MLRSCLNIQSIVYICMLLLYK